MDLERRENGCDEHPDALVRLTCDDVAEPSPELREHLATCAACRKALEEARALIGSLRVALEPEPLPESLRRRICERLDAPPTARWQALRAVPVRVACVAVAAGLLAAILVPWGWGRRAGAPLAHTVAGIELSHEDTAAIAAAYAILRWDGLAEYSAEVLTERVENVAKTVKREAGAQSLLPWAPEDDWDVPVSTGESSGLGSTRPVYAARAAAGTARDS